MASPSLPPAYALPSIEVRSPTLAWERLSVAVDGAPPGASRTDTEVLGLRLTYRIVDPIAEVAPGLLVFAGGVRAHHLLPPSLDLRSLQGWRTELRVEHLLRAATTCDATLSVDGVPLLWMRDGEPPTRSRIPGLQVTLCNGAAEVNGEPLSSGSMTAVGDYWVASQRAVPLARSGARTGALSFIAIRR